MLHGVAWRQHLSPAVVSRPASFILPFNLPLLYAHISLPACSDPPRPRTSAFPPSALLRSYALSPEKQRAVASETRRVWCSLAERLGMFALKVGVRVGRRARGQGGGACGRQEDNPLSIHIGSLINRGSPPPTLPRPAPLPAVGTGGPVLCGAAAAGVPRAAAGAGCAVGGV